MIDRRTYRRTPASRPLEIVSVSPNRRAPWQGRKPEAEATAPRKNFGRLLDIGCGGVGAILDFPVEVGTACEVRIGGPSGNVQTVRGRVCTLESSREGNRVGIALDNPVVTLGDVKRPGTRIAEDYDIRPLALVIDDDSEVRDTLSKFLTRRGLRVLPAADANQALAAIELEPPLVMLLDLAMPEVSGIQLLERMQDRDLSVPHIWAMSGYASDENALLSIELGATQFLAKPFDLDHLDYSLESLTA